MQLLVDVGRRRGEGGEKEGRRRGEGGDKERRRRGDGGEKGGRRREEGGKGNIGKGWQGRQREGITIFKNS